MHHSGIHATIAGVLLAFTIPTNISDTEISPLEKLEGMLHTPVNYLIMPILHWPIPILFFKKEWSMAYLPVLEPVLLEV